jgi:hypothetical protein
MCVLFAAAALQSVRVLDTVEDVLTSRYKWSREQEYERIDGDVSARKRNDMIQRFIADPGERVRRPSGILSLIHGRVVRICFNHACTNLTVPVIVQGLCLNEGSLNVEKYVLKVKENRPSPKTVCLQTASKNITRLC